MNKDQEILEEMVGEIIEEIAKHGKTRELYKLLDDAEKKGFVRYVVKNGKVMVKSLKMTVNIWRIWEKLQVAPVFRFLRKLGYS
jgi:glucan biosynthesis protein